MSEHRSPDFIYVWFNQHTGKVMLTPPKGVAFRHPEDWTKVRYAYSPRAW